MKISVIIPCYNEETFIGQAIGSVIEQTYPADEIIVVDDGSTDRSAEIARYFGEPVKVLRGLGEGAPKARNLGADHTTGDALMFLDADDVLGPQAMENLAACLQQYPHGIAACPWFRLQKIDNTWVQRPKSCLPLGNNQDYLSGWLTGWWHPPCSVLWSRAAYEITGGWDPDVTVNQDGDLMMRALAEGIKFRITIKGSAYYRRHSEGEGTASISSKRFTRSGRKSQIYVLHKIARKLEKRKILNDYRKPLTKALERLRRICKVPYPDLSNECLDLIRQYGEPGYVRIIRRIHERVYSLPQLMMNRTGGALTRLGFSNARRQLAGLKNKLLMHGEEQTGRNNHEKKEIEISFGIETYQKALEKGKLK